MKINSTDDLCDFLYKMKMSKCSNFNCEDCPLFHLNEVYLKGELEEICQHEWEIYTDQHSVIRTCSKCTRVEDISIHDIDESKLEALFDDIEGE
jgi:hypothetical protein